MPDTNSEVTPRELAQQIGVDPRTIRAYLRTQYGTLDAFTTRWRLDEERADDVRRHFAR
jgi:hypothetical protein